MANGNRPQTPRTSREEGPRPLGRRVPTAEAAPHVLAHWYRLLEGIRASPQGFYAEVEDALERRELPGASLARVAWQEGGLFSPRREYLRVRRREFVADVCGAPYGSGFFVSWWLGERPRGIWRLISRGSAFGLLAERWFRPQTYYAIDTALMFQQAVHAAVLEVVDGLTEMRGLRRIAESDRRPVLHERLLR